MGGGGNSPSLYSSPDSALTPTSETNVAYQGTFGDLCVTGEDVSLFGNFDNSSWEDMLNSAESMPPSHGFTPVNDGTTTVSPKDVFNDSIPPSTSFTNLTTPGSTFLETPDDGYEASPLFNDSLTADHGSDTWFSLFPDDGNNTASTPAPLMARTASGNSQVVVHPGGDSAHRKRSSTTASPSFSSVRPMSAVAGVNARKRDKPLPPIVVDEADPVALKRARNTAAARKSRDKKVHERDTFLAEIAELKAEVEQWKAMALGRASQGSD